MCSNTSLQTYFKQWLGAISWQRYLTPYSSARSQWINGITVYLNKRPVGLLSFAPFGPFWVRGEDSGQCLGSNWCFWRCGKNDEAIHRGKWLQLLTHLPLEKSRHFGDNILWCILVNEKYHILIKSYSELEESLDFLIVSCFNVSIFLIKEFATLVRPCFE